ncbi:hypothetical protein RJ641_028202, partial [Dillenia turbinata]
QTSHLYRSSRYIDLECTVATEDHNQSSTKSSSLIPQVVTSEEAIAINPEPLGTAEVLKCPQHSIPWLSSRIPQKCSAPAAKDTNRFPTGLPMNDWFSPQHLTSPEAPEIPQTDSIPEAKLTKSSDAPETPKLVASGPQQTKPPSLTPPQLKPSPETTFLNARLVIDSSTSLFDPSKSQQYTVEVFAKMPHINPSPPVRANIAGISPNNAGLVLDIELFLPQQITSCFPLASIAQKNPFFPNAAEIGPIDPNPDTKSKIE